MTICSVACNIKIENLQCISCYVKIEKYEQKLGKWKEIAIYF